MKYIISVLLVLLFSDVTAGNHNKKNDVIYEKVKVTSQITMLRGNGGNIGVVTGADGILIIDDQFKVDVNALDRTIREFGGLPKFIINTHWHGDHTGGNTLLGKSATIVAHNNVRKRLNSPQEIKLFNMKFATQPKSALPVITFDESLSIHFNGQHLQVVHYPGGHTDGDSVIFIEPANVVHMGDHYFSGMFPFVDLEAGGDVRKMAANIKKIITKLPADIKIIPGHGPLSTLDDLKAFHQMLIESISSVQKYIDDGRSLEQAQQGGLPVSLKDWGNGFLKEKVWISIVYKSLKI